MKTFACQLDIAWEDKKANFAKVHQLLRATSVPHGSLVVLPEMFATGFSFDTTRTLEEKGGITDRFLAELATDLKSFVIGGLVARGPAGKPHNLAVAYSPTGDELARYAKIQPFVLGGEAEHHVPGDQPSLFAWQEMMVAPFVCYDLRFPELFRTAVHEGAQLFAVIANWPVMRIHHWVTLLQARAIENQAYVVGVNRCGRDPKLNYNGRSLIVDPHGNILADAGAGEGVISADVDLGALTQWRRDFPALRDARA